MNNWVYIANFAISAAGLMIALYGLILTSASRYADRRTRNFLLLFFIVLALYIGSNLLAQIAEQFTSRPILTLTAIFFESLFSSLLLPLLALYMLIRCGEPSRSPVMYLIEALWLIYFALLTYTQISKNIYYVSADNVYHRGPLYPVLLVPPAFILIVILVALIRRRNRLTKRQFSAFLAYVINPVLSILVQMVSYGLHLILLGTVVAAAIMLIILLNDQADQAAHQKERIAKQHADLMVLQMRPHFIYNTLMSIYYLISQDPQKAQTTLLDFSTYLRKNFTAISKNELIPFEEELEHAKAYLAVEQVRFEDKLTVKYDTPYTDFELPPLTLQPLVENCVKHGVDPELDPLTIYVSTKKTDEGYDVIVADTGPGFGSSGNTGNSVALANIEERLDMMCDGSISIDCREGVGSVVTLHIPE